MPGRQSCVEQKQPGLGYWLEAWDGGGFCSKSEADPKGSAGEGCQRSTPPGRLANSALSERKLSHRCCHSVGQDPETPLLWPERASPFGLPACAAHPEQPWGLIFTEMFLQLLARAGYLHTPLSFHPHQPEDDRGCPTLTQEQWPRRQLPGCAALGKSLTLLSLGLLVCETEHKRMVLQMLFPMTDESEKGQG